MMNEWQPEPTKVQHKSGAENESNEGEKLNQVPSLAEHLGVM